MVLPLLKRAHGRDPHFLLTPKINIKSGSSVSMQFAAWAGAEQNASSSATRFRLWHDVAYRLLEIRPEPRPLETVLAVAMVWRRETQ